MAKLANPYHGRWRIEEAFKRLTHWLGLESVAGLSQHAFLVDVAVKALADNLAALLNRAVPMASGEPEGVTGQPCGSEQAVLALLHEKHPWPIPTQKPRSHQASLAVIQAGGSSSVG